MKTALVILLGAVGVGYVLLHLASTAGEKQPAASVPLTVPVTQEGDATQPHAPQSLDARSATAQTAPDSPFRTDRNCTVEYRDYVAPDGTTFSAYTCQPDEPAPPHPYAHYDNASLAAMAYDDAAAASLLGQRLIAADRERSYDLLLRAAALDGGNFRYLAWLSDQGFGIVAIDGVPQIANVMRQYELAALSARLGDTSQRSAYLRAKLRELGLSDEQLAALDDRADTLLLAMRDIQQTVQGEITIGGPSDA